MPLDDDDNPALAAALPLSTSAAVGGSSSTSLAADAAGEALTADDLIEDEGAASQDFRLFRKNAHVSAQTIRKGEKDFESHGTRAQADALEQSRAAMRDVLSYTRVHAAAAAARGNPARGWYFPGWWEGYEEEGDSGGQGEGEEAGEVQGERGKEGGEKREKRPFGYIRERVVVLEGSSVASMNLGRAVTGQAKDRPAKGKDWLLPEEALYLVERGSLDLWWPTKELEEIFPPERAVKRSDPEREGPEEADEYEMGFPLSLQAAYALLIGNDGERGKISLQKFQVYSNLKRCGYNVLRAPPIVGQPSPPTTTTTTTTLWQWFTSLLSSAPQHKPYGPLVQPGLYRSYASIYQQMALLPLHKPSLSPSSCQNTPSDPFTLHFHVWKSAQKWAKLRHPPPDFHLSVVDAQDSAVPTLGEITALIDATPPAPGKPEWTGPGRLYARLKHGHRNVLIAVVDHGVINYMRFAEAAFGEERLYGRFDTRGAPKGKKGGGRGGRGGGRGGRGRGR
ncbi:tRNA-splicing endonuclease subunit sen54 [Madurella fahalii]|uniref:tRNA-splicing endonuclease subunit sen54 n=1 Tax=Madurella fahalii TaxID=1157608 RepID=A0ABQ0G5Y1_9PEZI